MFCQYKLNIYPNIFLYMSSFLLFFLSTLDSLIMKFVHNSYSSPTNGISQKGIYSVQPMKKENNT